MLWVGAVCFACGSWLFAAGDEGAAPVYPVPHQASIGKQYVRATYVSMATRDKKGGKTAMALLPHVPKISGAYRLVVKPSGVAVAAHDERGLFYAKQTLLQLLKNVPAAVDMQADPYPNKSLKEVAAMGPLPVCDITDWPDVEFRGTVEGFYGSPWSHESRKRQLMFYGRNKMNVYIYAPKDDPWHHGRWREPYPETEAKQIKELIDTANANFVNFVWAIHPGNSVRWNEGGGKADLDAIVAKLEMMYKLGVRQFGVFIDDSGGEIGNASRQVELCQYVQKHFVEKHKDVLPLLMCPTGYNRSWTNENNLKTLGQGLDPSIRVMWTGDSVVHDITLGGQKWVAQFLKCPTFVWWNFPVTDFVGSRLLMGRVYGLDTNPEIKKYMSGFSSNPMDKPEASKVTLFSIADYCWNIEAFNSERSWKDGIRRLFPGCAAAMQVFCNHNSDHGPNYHGYRREESVEIAPVVEKAMTSLGKGAPDKKAFEDLKAEFVRMAKAPAVIRAKANAPGLIEEIDRWLVPFELMGRAGAGAVVALTEGSVPAFVQATSAWDEADRQRAAMITPNRHMTPGQSGTKVLQPALRGIMQAAAAKISDKLGGKTAKAVEGAVSFAESTVRGLATLIVQKGDGSIGLAPVLEIHKMRKGDTIVLKVPAGCRAKGAEIDLENGELGNWAEVSVKTKDGGARKLTVTGGRFAADEKALPPGEIVELALTNAGQSVQEIKIKAFKINLLNADDAKNPAMAFDSDLTTVFRCDEDAMVEVPCPRGAKAAVVLGSAAMSITAKGGSVQTRPMGNEGYLVKWDGKVSALVLKIKGKQGTSLNEVIFR